MDLDGLVVIGGDDSATNAAFLAEAFAAAGSKCVVASVPKTIDGDLAYPGIVPTSFGFDTACKVRGRGERGGGEEEDVEREPVFVLGGYKPTLGFSPPHPPLPPLLC